MKFLGYSLLFCGLVSSLAWGQSAPKDEPLVVVRYVSLSCSAAQPFSRRAKAEVVLGGFDSYRATVLNVSPSLVLWQASGSDKEDEIEMLLGKTSTFSLPAVIVGVRPTTHTEPARPVSQPQQNHRLGQEHSETLQAHGRRPR